MVDECPNRAWEKQPSPDSRQSLRVGSVRRSMISESAGNAVAALERAGAENYDRVRHLPWLARATPDELASRDPAVTRMIVARLSRALRAERRRGRAGHWTYDLNRHIALSQALAAERRRLGHS